MNICSATKRLHPLKVALFLGAGVLFLGLMAMPAAGLQGQTQGPLRKVKLSPPPEYPELARKMSIQGVARVLVWVNPDGKVADVKELGGNPVLVAALVQAVKKWRYEAADKQTTIEVRFEFK
jgi:TonB family protein